MMYFIIIIYYYDVSMETGLCGISSITLAILYLL